MSTNENLRIAVFGSSIRGYWMLRHLLDSNLQRALGFEIVGVVTDNPNNVFSNSAVPGTWKYGFDPNFEPRLVPRLVEQRGIDLYYGNIKTSSFISQFRSIWRPDLCLVNVFGQLLLPELFKFPRLGCFNFHSMSGEVWPSFQGPDPYEQMFRMGIRTCKLAMHHVNEKFDDGALYRFSESVVIPEGATVSDMHLLTAPLAVSLLRRELPTLLGRETCVDC